MSKQMKLKNALISEAKWGKHDLYKMYDNVTDLAADVIKYIKMLEKDINKDYADQMKEVLAKSIKDMRI